ADEAIDDPTRLLGIDKVRVDVARLGERLEDRPLRDLVEGPSPGLVARHARGLSDVPGNRLTFTVEVRREIDDVRALRFAGDRVDVFPAVVADDVFGGEIVVDVDAELALAGVLRKVAHVSVRGEDPVVV